MARKPKLILSKDVAERARIDAIEAAAAACNAAVHWSRYALDVLNVPQLKLALEAGANAKAKLDVAARVKP